MLLHVSRAVEAAVTALHVDHGLHPDSPRWERHCAGFCHRLGVGFLSRRADPVRGGEAGARAARYAVFEELLGVDDLLLLGHHRDDQAETVLLRLIQGRAPLGMPRTRRLEGGARILRPWLSTPRDTLLSHAGDAGLDWIEDPTNLQTDFDRNFLRREIVPRLAARWPEAIETLAATATGQLARDALLDRLVDSGWASAESGAAGDDTGDAPAAGNRDRQLALEEFPADLRVAVLRLWLRSLGEYAASDRALAEFVRQFDAPPDAHPRLALTRGVLRRHGAYAVYSEPELELASSYRLEPPGTLTLPHGELEVERHGAGFHAAGALEVRFRQGGERIRQGGRSRSVKKLLHAAGIPPWRRRTWPLVYAGKTLLAVPGIASADSSDGAPRWRASWRSRSVPFARK